MHLAMRLHLAKAKKTVSSLQLNPPGKKKPAAGPEVVEDPDYEELADGTFQCLRCEKSYKPSSRAESYMQTHVMREHR